METLTAAQEPVADTTPKKREAHRPSNPSLVAWTISLRAKNAKHWTWDELGKQIGGKEPLSGSVILTWTKSNYAGSADTLDRIERGVEQLRSRSELQDGAHKPAGQFVETMVTEQVFHACQRALALKTIVIIYGEAGLGKSRALKQFREVYSESALMFDIFPTLNDKWAARKMLLSALHRQKLPDANSPTEQLCKFFADTNLILLLDDAHCLQLDALEFFFLLHKKSGVPIVCAANEDLRKTIDGTTSRLRIRNAQLKRLVGREITVGAVGKAKHFNQAEIAALVGEYVTDPPPSLLDLAREIANKPNCGHLGTLKGVLAEMREDMKEEGLTAWAAFDAAWKAHSANPYRVTA